MIESPLRTAAILHNMLIVHDDFEFEYNTKIIWENLDPDAESESVDEVVKDVVMETVGNLDTWEILNLNTVDESKYCIRQFELKRNSLNTHFSKQYQKGELYWPNHMHQDKRQKLAKVRDRMNS